MQTKTYIIAGPTASGKSDFAEWLAARTGAIIINSDSVQIYNGINAISAAPTPAPNLKLFSALPMSRQISVAEYLDMARPIYDAAIRSGANVIFVGGTGFYIDAIINGISPMPTVSADSRHRAREIITRNKLGGTTLPRDPQRAARALEIEIETGHPIEYWQAMPRTGAIAPNAIKILINPSVDILSERIRARIPKMLDMGAADEARGIIAAGLPENRAIGAAQLCKYLRGEITLDTAIQNWTTKTLQYAKRQRTWFRHKYAPDITIDHVPTSADIKLVLPA